MFDQWKRISLCTRMCWFIYNNQILHQLEHKQLYTKSRPCRSLIVDGVVVLFTG